MNRSTLRNRFAGIVLLLGFSLACAESGAAAETVASPPIAREHGHFLDVPALLENRAEAKTSPLLAGVKAPKLEPQTSEPGYHLSSATLVRDNNEPGGFLIIVSRDDGSFLALVDGPNRSGLVLGQADGTQTFNEDTKEDFLKDDTLIDPQEQARAEAQKESLDNLSSGDTQITVLMGYSEAAVDYVGDATAHSLVQLETVNMALRNSGVAGVRLVLGEVATTPKNYPMIGSTLGALSSIFPNTSGSNLVAGYFMPTPEDAAGGIAHVGGRYSINHVTGGTVFRHEIGHNASGRHCNEGSEGYAFGYGENGHPYRTILCGNDLPYYSTPNRSVNGHILGDAKTADMARAWQEQTHRMASYGESEPFLIQSQASSTCVDSHGSSVGTKVGLWACSSHNPRQIWVKAEAGDKFLIRLESNPTLCLGKPYDGSTSEIALRMCSDGLLWEEVVGQFRSRINERFVYLNRKSDDTLDAVGVSSQPGQRWQKLPVEPSFLIQSMADPSRCVDAHSKTEGGKVELWSCNENNPNQQWKQSQAGTHMDIRLKANPTLCLAMDGEGSTRDIVLKACNQTGPWEVLSDQFRAQSNSFLLYLNRTSNDKLEASSNSHSEPGSRWRKQNISIP